MSVCVYVCKREKVFTHSNPRKLVEKSSDVCYGHEETDQKEEWQTWYANTKFWI